MGSRRPSTGSPSLGRRVHALVERYTPDGALGRFLLGATTGPFGLWLLAIVVFSIPRWGLSLAALFWTPVLLAFGLPLVVLSLLTLWPIYLSLIGNIDSAADYPVGGANDSRTTESRPASSRSASRGPGESPSETREGDPFGDLKAKYENGDLSEDEFERRLEARLQDGEQSVTDRTSATDRDRTRTTERN